MAEIFLSVTLALSYRVASEGNVAQSAKQGWMAQKRWRTQCLGKVMTFLRILILEKHSSTGLNEYFVLEYYKKFTRMIPALNEVQNVD